MRRRAGRASVVAGLALLLAALAPAGPAAAPGGETPPARLADTGLYADFARGTIHPEALPYAPQYPLWSDGASKRRWIRLPPGTAIDGRDPDRWDFPVGTRLWKEFSFGRRVETRFMERTRAGWIYATYAWTADGRDAVRAPAAGVPGAAPGAPGRTHDLPSVADCRACHEGHRSRVLGFSALQLSPDRDPLAPHAEPPPAGGVDLPGLVRRGLLRHHPDALRAPRIAAATPRERAALGYLHANCGGCHDADGALAALGLDLEQRLARPAAGPLPTAVGRPSGFRPAAAGPSPLRIAPGQPGRSVLALRLRATDPIDQMPPLGRKTADGAAAALVEAWIQGDLGRAPHHAAPHEEEDAR